MTGQSGQSHRGSPVAPSSMRIPAIARPPKRPKRIGVVNVVGNHDLGATIIVEVGRQRPVSHCHGRLGPVPGIQLLGPQTFSPRRRERRQRRIDQGLRDRSLAALECKNFHDTIAVEVRKLDWPNRREAQIECRSRHPAGRRVEADPLRSIDQGHERPFRLGDVRDAMVKALTRKVRELLVDRVIPKLLARPAGHGHDNAPACENSLGWRTPSHILARLGYKRCGIVENGKFRDQVHRAVAINIDRRRHAHDPARPTVVIGRTWRPRFAGIGRVRPEQRAILARQSQKRRRPANGPDEVAVPSPLRSGVGWTSSPGRFRSPKWDSRRSAATGSRSGLHGRAGRAASQIGLPVDPSRRIKVSPFHSMKSALPGLNVTVSVTDENGMDSAPSKRLSSKA